MSVTSSTAREVERLITQLRSDDAAARDAAVARLRIIGTRALDRLTAVITGLDATPAERAAALQVLEGLDDVRARTLALTALHQANEMVVAAAVAVLRTWVTAAGGVGVLDALTALALDQARPAQGRMAALDAIAQLPRDLVRPIIQSMENTGAPGNDAPQDDPIAARDWLATQSRAPLSAIHDFVVAAREQERLESSARRRQDWLVTRGAAHALLARRGSRVALYDLRETFDAAKAPLPLDFLTAVTAIGDADCLEPMARAWRAAPRNDTWWRERLADAARDILHRLKLTGRSAAVKRVRAKYPEFV